ncbi:MAG: DUF1015 domain-containing protein [Candidatus Omnitrophica bacterium]|nr:DUF1015 domain-containing protein [Candidatus Omnitrophota bacterium]MDE2010189.1 DUF1015 domain-containing protein [Candidatus Omnitrophota bacterium]MDE2215077.1 DUF1015 domain-containing protein [Candidatus Omnitrophota bacterium]MDE2232206.1 DUF1015 domain-containing protein [Candidatus Omnitrophota bacterium]
MSALKPFAAVFYNQEKIDNLSNVFCPPYDIISPQQQDDFYKQDPYNFIRLELAKESPKDNDKDNKYTRSRKTYEDWLKKGILKKDTAPCIYFYKQDYKYQGRRYTRMGFLGLLKLNEDSGVRILPHEHTHAAAKTDRFTLWSALKSDLSPIFVGYADKGGRIDKVFLKELAMAKPYLEAVDHDKVKHTIWRLEDPARIQEIVNVIDGQDLFICDGHHRFEVANQIRREALKKVKRSTGDEPFNYVMTYFTNMDSRDLQIFPIHRIVRKFPISVNLLEQYFRIDKVKTKVDWLVLLARAGQNEHAFGLYNKQGMFLLRLKNKMLIDKMVKEGSRDYRSLDAAILKAFILDQVGVTAEDIVFSKDPDEVLQAVNEGGFEAGFILNSVSVRQLRSIALNDERMPPKTTYFYPKVLSGLTIYKMD